MSQREEYQQAVHEATKVVAWSTRKRSERNLSRYLWLDSHGKCLWNSKLRPANILVFERAA